MNLTKTDFLQYLNCSNSLWLLKNKPEVFKKYKGEKSLFLEKLIREGYEVEEYVEKLFPKAQDLGDMNPIGIQDFLSKNLGKFFQATFETEKGAFARVDMLEVHPDKTISLYEIKSSTYDDKKGIKSYNKKHFKDLAFQKYVLEKDGYIVKDMNLIYLDKTFIKDEEINPEKLLHIGNVTEKINEIFDVTVLEIESALEYIKKKEINENLCSCLENTRTNHCETFLYFNKNIPEHSIYELNNIRAAKIIKLKDLGIESISDIPSDFDLSDYQILQKEAVENNLPLINEENIKTALNKLKFPLYFFDYETLPFAVPKIDGYGPHAQVPTQYSLHVLEKNGNIQHFEYLTEKLENPKKLIETMKGQIGNVGTLISWYASFEKTRNKEMAKMFPEYEDFLMDINSRTYDLMDIFKKDYIDKNFEGSMSIKKVQPVLVPDLSYKVLDVQSGTMAVDTTERLFLEMIDEEEIKNTRKALLKYCELDTLAMVRIYEVLKK